MSALTASLDIVRAQDRDRYLAALLAPAPARDHLLALYAFDLELRAIGERVNEPLAGEMRLQWWRDALAAQAHGGASGNPVADDLQAAIAAGRLPLDALQASVDAHDFDFYNELFATDDELTAYLGASFGAITQFACLILAGGEDSASGTAAGHAGVAAGLLWVLLNLPRHAAKGRLYLPGDMLARHGVDAQALLQGRDGPGLATLTQELIQSVEQRLAAVNAALPLLAPSLRPAFAHLAPARTWLAALAARNGMLDAVRAPSPLRRQWRIWRFMRGAGL